MTSKRSLERRLETVEERIISEVRARATAATMVVPENALRSPIEDDPLIREDGVITPGRGFPLVVAGSDVHEQLTNSESEEPNQ